MFRTIGLTCLFIWLLSGSGASALAAPGDVEYVPSLGSTSATNGSVATGINDAGAVVGYACTTNEFNPYHAFIRPSAGAALIDLAPHPGDSSQSTAINNAGVVTGWSPLDSNPGYERAFIRAASGGAIQSAGVNTGSYSRAYAINSNGDIAGYIGFINGGPMVEAHPFIRLADGTVQDLGVPLGALAGDVSAINDARDIAGRYYPTANSARAFVRRQSTGVFQDIGTFGGTYTEVNAINRHGDVVGESQDGGGKYHAFLFSASDNLLHPLPELTAATTSYAGDIDDLGDIVGASDLSGSSLTHATLWHRNGALIDLDAWLDSVNPTAGSNWTLTSARALNSSGLIIGQGQFDDGPGGLPNGNRAFVLDASPVLAPEPGALSLVVGGGMLSFLMRRRRSRA
jgi:probable HAF family extracellular repeat protein